MRPRTTVAVLAVLLSALIGCAESDGADGSMETSQQYSLCPKGNDSRQRLDELFRRFARQENARLSDRGAQAQQELAAMETGAGVLHDTGGELAVIRVYKPNYYSISASNLGLKEKFGLAVRFSREAGDTSAVNEFMDELSRFWTIQRVEGGVNDDPSC